MLDLLLCRYANIEYLMNMEHKQGFKLILKAIEKNNDEELFEQWLHDTARFELDFNSYKKQLMPYRKSTEAEKEEILKKWGA